MKSHHTTSKTSPAALFTAVLVDPFLQDNSNSTLTRPIVPHRHDDDDNDDDNSASIHKNKMDQLRFYARIFGMAMGFFTAAATMAPQLPLLLSTTPHDPTSPTITGTTATEMTTISDSEQSQGTIVVVLWCILVYTMFYTVLCLVSVMIKTASTSPTTSSSRRGSGDIHGNVIHSRCDDDDDDNNPWMTIVEREGMTWCIYSIIWCYTLMDVLLLPRRTPFLFLGVLYLVAVIALHTLRWLHDLQAS